jgi:hypothetical protein
LLPKLTQNGKGEIGTIWNDESEELAIDIYYFFPSPKFKPLIFITFSLPLHLSQNHNQSVSTLLKENLGSM